MPVRVLTGPTVLEQLGDRLDALHAATGTPVTARRRWLQAWVDTTPGWNPVAVTVEAAADAPLTAAALLAVRRVGALDRVVLLGHGPSDLLVLPSLGPDAAADLADGVASWLDGRRRPWHLSARHLRDEPAAGALAAALRHSRTLPGDVSPVLVAEHGGSLDTYVSGNHRRGTKRFVNRLAREGHTVTTRHLEDPVTIAAEMDEVERVMRARDHELGRVSDVDVPSARQFFRTVVARHAEVSQVRLDCTDIDGRLAAYVLSFLDGSVVRMWNCRFDPALGRYAPGRIAMDSSIRHALEAGATAYDFMRGDERYKSSYSTHRPTAVDLSASSHRPLHGAESLVLAVRGRLRRMEAHGGRQAEIATRTRRLLGR